MTGKGQKLVAKGKGDFDHTVTLSTAVRLLDVLLSHIVQLYINSAKSQSFPKNFQRFTCSPSDHYSIRHLLNIGASSKNFFQASSAPWGSH